MKYNPVAKNLNKFNKPATHKDRKKAMKCGAKPKHRKIEPQHAYAAGGRSRYDRTQTLKGIRNIQLTF